MLVTNLFFKTQREVPSDAEIPSHQLMLRAGLMRQMASGVYAFLPLGYKTFRKVEAIVREEMDRAGAQELIMPAILPSELYIQSGRWEKFGPEMFRLSDRHNRPFCLGPTHEEAFTETVKNVAQSYRDLPVTLYQIQHKYRDEKRPRFGVMRSREFVMKDAYSFDRDPAGLDASYRAMDAAYRRIFDRCGLDYMVVDADSGAMGGSGSQEFMVKSAVGEAGIAFCPSCDYAANDEQAPCAAPVAAPAVGDVPPMASVATPAVRTIEELTAFFDTTPQHFAKTLLYLADGQVVAVMVRGDREVNETKLANLLGCLELALADAQTVLETTGASVGFAGPVGMRRPVPLIADHEVAVMRDLIMGANQPDHHYVHADFARDVTGARAADVRVADVRTVAPGDPCPHCGAPLEMCRGIEVGHIFKLGTHYTQIMDCTYLDEAGKAAHMVMGCYGIGVNRTMAAIIEQNNDEHGIVWPLAVAPYQAIVVPVNAGDAAQTALARTLYERLIAVGVECLLDDRDERPGVKFKDADLIGIPLRITVGRKAGDGVVELKDRQTGVVSEVTAEQAIARITAAVRALEGPHYR